MVDDARKEKMKQYQKGRTASRNDRKLTSRTVWIRAEDVEAFQKATAVFVDHARLIEAVTGGPGLPAKDIIDIIDRHALPYDPSDLIFLSRLDAELWHDTLEPDQVREKAKAILSKYHIPVSMDLLLRG